MKQLPSQHPPLGQPPELICIEASHRSAPVDFRERLALSETEWATLLQAKCPAVQEWALVVTCNRWELYIATGQGFETAYAQLQEALSAAVGQPFHAFTSYLRVHRDSAAARHLCRVTAGLESVVLGEAQIQGQVAHAYQAGVERGSVGPVLSALMQTALRTGRRARSETRISARAATMSSVAFAMAEAHAGDLAGKRITVVGAGEMVRLALQLLHSRRVKTVTVANRTLARAQALLLDDSWRAVGLDALGEAIAQADIVFCATRAPGLVIPSSLVTAIPVETRQGKILIDLALPRDVDPALRNLTGITLIDVDDLREELDQGLASRRRAIPQVEALIEEALQHWQHDLRGLSIRPLVLELRLKAEQIRRQEVERTLRFLGDVDDDTRAHLDLMTRALVNKLLHEPTMHIKSLAEMDEAAQHATTIRAIFGLESEPTSSHEPTVSH